MRATLDALMHRHWPGGGDEALLVYAVVLFAMGLGLALRGASWGRYLSAVFVAVFLAVLGAVLWALLLKAVPALVASPFLGLAGFAVLGFAAGYLGPGRGGDPLHVRGAQVEATPERPLSARTQARLADRGQLSFAGHPLAPLDETKHFKLIGTTGTGKSTAIRELLQGALRRGDRAVIADPDGGYLAQFYDPKRGDVILNPFDRRSRRWDLFGEIHRPYDAAQLALSLIGAGEGSDRSWRQYAQTFLASVVSQLREAGETDLSTLYRLLTIAPTEELKILLAGTPAGTFLEDGNERMFGSIRSVTGVAVSALAHIERQAGDPLAVRDWIRNGRGVLFLPYQAGQISALRSIISTWMRIAIFEAMSLPTEDSSRMRRAGQGQSTFIARARANGAQDVLDGQRCWFVVDELDALGAIDGLKDALARLRKFGGRCVLGFQSIAQVSGTYGDAEAQTIVENCGNTLILRCSASEGGGTARFASRLIGERVVLREQVTHSRSGGFFQEPHRTETRSEQQVTELAVLPSQIEQLPDLEGFLKVASTPQWRRVRLGA